MTQARFTPGPWEALPWESENGGTDWNVWGPKRSNHAHNPDLQGDFGSEADARLIAAAPDLLGALKGMDAFWTADHPAGPDGDPTTMCGLATLTDETLAVWRNIRAAIAKAEGTQ